MPIVRVAESKWQQKIQLLQMVLLGTLIFEHFGFHGIYTLEMSCDPIPGLQGINPMLLRAKIKSRHSSGKTYFVFIVTERGNRGGEAIISYYCNCIVGLRTVGCCSHVMSIIWYLGYARHEGVTRPANFLDDVILRV
ncbi:unnamed protein product [Leptidea sinapis]|uniref:SWIM-type domain-containing protein n=1 Tax=Leptidea sinapis TaxID=189913 RepID=A0A5E4PWJ7_9NEOP|nr:unnamed protein product [Leptidea sinapis]